MAFRSGSIPGLIPKHVLLIGLLSLLTPIAAQANSSSLTKAAGTCVTGIGVCIQNQGGTANASTSGFTMTGSNASTVINIGGTSAGGTLSLTTGGLVSGTLAGGGAGATFEPGTLTITTTGYAGFSGTLFTGTFGDAFSPITWKLVSHAGGEFLYELTGPISGIWENNISVSGETAQLFFKSKTALTNKGGTIGLADGSTLIVTPEPGTLSLMGTGLIGLAALIKRKLVRNNS